MDRGLITGKFGPGFFTVRLEFVVGVLNEFQRGHIREVDTISQVDYRSDDEGFLNLVVKRVLGMFLNEFGPSVGTLGIIFPEVGSTTEPVVWIAADSEVAFTEEKLFSCFPVASMIAQND
jgi:hypothetical protein